jgi:hypothetical protein
MKSSTSFLFFCTAASLILAACGTAPLRTPSPSPSSLVPAATSSSPSATPIRANDTPKITTTAAFIPCNLTSADYCVGNATFVFQSPIAPPGIDTVDRGYPYGSTEGGKLEPHHGVEFYNPSGTPVLAAAGGTVYFSGDDTVRKFSPWYGFYGDLIVLEHTISGAPFDKLYTLYAHLSKMDVTTGQAVNAGDKIGEVGLSGTATGSHLHFEVRIVPDDYSSTLNPEMWLTPLPGNGTLALIAINQDGGEIIPTFNIQYYPNRDQPAAKSFEVDGYTEETINHHNPWGEIAALGNQPAGWYRITFYWAGEFYERWVEIPPNDLTLSEFKVK